MESNVNDTFGPTTPGAGDSSDAGSRTGETSSAGLKHTIADALESGAARLRQQAAGTRAAGAGADGSIEILAEDNRLAQTSNQIAGGMQGAAEWIRDADLDAVKSGLERQVKEHPGRTLAIAVGVGYLLGKAFRR